VVDLRGILKPMFSRGCDDCGRFVVDLRGICGRFGGALRGILKPMFSRGCDDCGRFVVDLRGIFGQVREGFRPKSTDFFGDFSLSGAANEVVFFVFFEGPKNG
jgi:hypothetical protein